MRLGYPSPCKVYTISASQQDIINRIGQGPFEQSIKRKFDISATNFQTKTFFQLVSTFPLPDMGRMSWRETFWRLQSLAMWSPALVSGLPSLSLIFCRFSTVSTFDKGLKPFSSRLRLMNPSVNLVLEVMLLPLLPQLSGASVSCFNIVTTLQSGHLLTLLSLHLSTIWIKKDPWT